MALLTLMSGVSLPTPIRGVALPTPTPSRHQCGTITSLILYICAITTVTRRSLVWCEKSCFVYLYLHYHTQSIIHHACLVGPLNMHMCVKGFVAIEHTNVSQTTLLTIILTHPGLLNRQILGVYSNNFHCKCIANRY